MTNKNWTEKEIEFLKENYLTMDFNEISKTVKRTRRAVQSKMSKLGIRKLGYWNNEQIDLLLKNYKIMSNKELSFIIKKPKYCVQSKITRLRLNRGIRINWEQDQIKTLKDEYKNRSNKDLSSIVGKTEKAVSVQLTRLGLKRIRTKKNTKHNLNEKYITKSKTIKNDYKKEFKFIKESFLNLSNVEISKGLNISTSKVITIMKKFGIKRPNGLGRKLSPNGGRHSEETKNKIRNSLKGRTLPLNVRRKIGLANRGKKLNPELKKRLSDMKKGAKNPFYGKNHSKKSRDQMSLNRQGEKHHNWMGGKSFEPYTCDFNPRFKRKIKERDSYTCQICNINKYDVKQLKTILVIHHVNYDKILSIPQNCITLCNRCHIKTNYNRTHWTKFFQSLLSEKYGYKFNEEQKVILEFKDGL